MHRESVRIRGAEGDYKWQIKRKGLPEEVAALVTWLLCDASSYITGTIQVFYRKMRIEKCQRTDNSRLLTAAMFAERLIVCRSIDIMLSEFDLSNLFMDIQELSKCIDSWSTTQIID